MSEVPRRDILKALIPGAWAFDLRKGQGMGGLSTSARIGLVKDIALITLGSAAILSKERTPRSFKDRVLSFSWDQTEGRKLEGFTNDLADEYLRLTKTTRVTKQDLTGTHFFKDTTEFVRAIKVDDPGFNPGESLWGRTHYPTRQVFIDLARIKEQSFAQALKNMNPDKIAGNAILQALWHEWTRLDLSERQTGQFINNPQAFFDSPISGNKEVFRRYRGGAVFTDTYFGYTRFESVWNNTIVVRRMFEQVGLDFALIAGDYYENGTDFFPLFTRVANIPLETLYEMHATSDFEGIMELVGQKLPGIEPALVKGERLFTAIHKNDSKLIQQTGVYNLLPKGQ